jgi:hypothetical protein
MRSETKQPALPWMASLLLLSSVTGLNAQILEWADARVSEVHAKRVLPIGGNRWAVLGKLEFAGWHGITIWDANGGYVAEAGNDAFHDSGNGNVVLMPDSGFLHAGAVDDCDNFPPVSRIKRYSADGQMLWDTTFVREEGWQTPRLAAKSTIMRMAVAGDSTWIFDLQGTLLDAWPTPDQGWYLKELLWLNDSTLLFLFPTGARRFSVAGTDLGSAVVGDPVDAHIGEDGQLLVLTQSALIVHDSGLVPTATIPLPPAEAPRRLHPTSSALYLSTAQGLHRVEGSAFVWLMNWPELPSVVNAGAAVRDSTVLLTGTETTAYFKHGVMRTLSLQGAAAQHDEDVELLLEADSAWVEFVAGNFWNKWAQLTVRIVNHGSGGIGQVTISSRTMVPWIACAEPGLHVEVNGLSIAPGDTAVVWSGTHLVHSGSPFWTGTSTMNICAAALAPNSKADRAPLDNHGCVSADFTIGMGEHHAPRVALSPNPATQEVLISGIAALGDRVHVALCDAAGRMVLQLEQSATSSGTLSIDVSMLRAGAYRAAVTGTGGRATAQLVVLAH